MAGGAGAGGKPAGRAPVGGAREESVRNGKGASHLRLYLTQKEIVKKLLKGQGHH